MRRSDLFQRFRTDDVVIDYFWESNLLIYELDCPIFHERMRYEQNWHAYRCYKSARDKRCNQELKINKGYSFIKKNLYLKIVFIIYKFT